MLHIIPKNTSEYLRIPHSQTLGVSEMRRGTQSTYRNNKDSSPSHQWHKPFPFMDGLWHFLSHSSIVTIDIFYIYHKYYQNVQFYDVHWFHLWVYPVITPSLRSVEVPVRLEPAVCRSCIQASAHHKVLKEMGHVGKTMPFAPSPSHHHFHICS